LYCAIAKRIMAKLAQDNLSAKFPVIMIKND